MSLEPGAGRRHMGWAACPTCGKRTRVARTGLFFRHPSSTTDGRLDHTRDCGASGKPWNREWDTAAMSSERSGAS